MRIPKGFNAVVIGSDRDSAKNYMEKVVALARAIPEGDRGRYDVDVRHEGGCPILNGGGYCGCDPDVALVERKGGSAASVVEGVLDGAARPFQIDHEAKGADPKPPEGVEADDPKVLAVRLGQALVQAREPGIVLVVDRGTNQARCEFTGSEADMVKLMTCVWTAAVLQIPDDKKMAFMADVIDRANYSMFDPKGDLYRPYGSDLAPGERP